ncbi:hypothetical protein ACFLRC_03770, partial [Candidatus Altiarchaeota archaeon]
FNSTCVSDLPSSTGFNWCNVSSNASFDSQVFEHECTSGYLLSTNCFGLSNVNCEAAAGCEYALEGNLTLYNVSNNGVYWWSVECSCDYSTAVSNENWTFTVDKQYGN